MVKSGGSPSSGSWLGRTPSASRDRGGGIAEIRLAGEIDLCSHRSSAQRFGSIQQIGHEGAVT
jgi:hypothetical protein